MLTPVRAVSNASAATPKPAVATATSLINLGTTPDAAVALSRTVSASVEGKLNMLLIAARDRMIQSLLDIINAVSQSLDQPREPEEDNVSHALRLADIIHDLPPKQLAAVQQQLQAQGQTLPLQLIAQALRNPAGPEAAQVVAYLEAARYKDRDPVTEAVIGSYGENEGWTEAQEPQAAGMPPQEAETRAAPPAAASPAAASGEARTAPAVPPAVLPAAEEQAQAQTAPVETAEQAIVDPPASAAAEETATADDTKARTPAPVAADAARPQAAIAGNQPAETAVRAQQAMQAAIPAELKQIAADIQEGLKVVILSAMDIAGPEIAAILAQGEQAADAAIAQALIADVLDGPALQQAAPENADELPMPAAAVAAQAAETVADEPASLPANLARLLDGSAASPQTAVQAAVQMADMMPKPMPPLSQAVPFAIAQYLPAEDAPTAKDDLRIDRVDPVGDEAEGDGGRQERASQEEEQDQASGQPEETGTPMAEAIDADEAVIPAAAGEERDAAPLPLALPMPAPAEPLRQPAYDFYQRMVGWE